VAHEGLESAIHLLDGRVHEAMAASDVAVIASGTATLEAMLLDCPMVVAYRLAPLSHFFLKRTGLLRIQRYALPNILAGRGLVPELMQGAVTAEALAAAALAWLEDPDRVRAYRRECRRFHDDLRQNADQRAAVSVRALVRARKLSGVNHGAR
jgi:lipid-A-disaccharide synthase